MNNGRALAFTMLALGVVVAGAYAAKADSGRGKAVIDNSRSPHVKLRCIPMQDTRWTEGFWAERFDLAATRMLPALENTMLGESTANLNRMKQAAPPT